MRWLIKVRVLSESSRLSLVDVKGVGEPSVCQNDVSKFHEWTKKMEDYWIGIEPHLEAMSTWTLRNGTDIRSCMVADQFGAHGDPTEQVDGYAQVVVQLHMFWRISRKETVGRNVVGTDWKRGEVYTNLLTH